MLTLEIDSATSSRGQRVKYIACNSLAPSFCQHIRF